MIERPEIKTNTFISFKKELDNKKNSTGNIWENTMQS
jgi:hypothetical protein